MADADLATGRIFAGHRIEGIAGRGGMGVVYKATHLALDHLVALKVISPALANDERFRRRFGEESRIAVSIRHPNVVPIHNAGEEDGLLYVTMDLIDGTDLRGDLNREGTLEPRRAARIISEVASALDAAHGRGLVHRDIKPGNILIEGSGENERVFLTDFGLARQVDANTGVTATGAFVGTLDYVAPEQIRGERVDARADVYALGCVLFELLTGNAPFAARDDKVAKMYAHLEEDPPSLRVLRPDLPGGLDLVIKRALAKDPAERFPSAGDFARAVDAAVEGEATVEAERSVGVGAAAPGPPEATTTAERERVPAAPEPTVAGSTVAEPTVADEPASTPTPSSQADTSISRRSLLAFGAVGAAALVVVAIIATSGGGGGDTDGGSTASTSATKTTTGTETTAIAPTATVDDPSVPVGTLPVNPFHGEKGLWVNNRKSGTVSFVDGDPAKQLEQFDAGSFPEAVVEAFGSLWVSQGRGNSVLRLDPETGAVQGEITTGAQPGGMAVGDGSVWAANFGGDTIARIDPDTGAVRHIEVGDAPYGIALDGTSVIWVSNRESDTVTPITASQNRPGPSIPVGDNPKGIAVDDDGKVWVANSSGDTVSVVQNGKEQNTVTVGSEPRGVVFAFGSIWVSVAGTNQAVRIDPTNETIVQKLTVGQVPEGITAGPKSVWVANGATNDLTRIDPGVPAG
jgi:YVTN family beta-propeller protein